VKEDHLVVSFLMDKKVYIFEHHETSVHGAFNLLLNGYLMNNQMN